MLTLGLTYTVLSGLCNGLFSAPMKVIPRWKWENIWLVFILTACVAIPVGVAVVSIPDLGAIWSASPAGALTAALVFGFGWGFGAALFGMSVDRLGVSLANSLVIGLSSGLGSLVPLLLEGNFSIGPRHMVLIAGVVVFLVAVWICGSAGRMRDRAANSSGPVPLTGYLFAIGSGVMSAVFNIGYALAQPVADAGVGLGLSRFTATNYIWLLMLVAGSLPNIIFCLYLVRRNRAATLFFAGPAARTWGLSVLMGILWGASIYLYGAATPLLGDIGPSVGWPVSLAVGLVVANFMGLLLGEWRDAGPVAARRMRLGILVLLVAIVLCSLAPKLSS